MILGRPLDKKTKGRLFLSIFWAAALAAKGTTVSVCLDASSTDGLEAGVSLVSGPTRLSAKVLSEPGKPLESAWGFTCPLVVAGRVRSSGILRVMTDPCGDAYLFDGDYLRPLAVDLDSARNGIFLGGSTGVWAVDGTNPHAGLWMDIRGEAGPFLGCAAALSLLPEVKDFETWFSEDPCVPGRALAAAMAWAGFESDNNRIFLSAAFSEEDRGQRGWSVRAEGELWAGNFRWNGRFSFASAGWKGLAGDRADIWEVRSDASWLIKTHARLEGRFRSGIGRDGLPDWEGLARASWFYRGWRVKACVEGVDSEISPFFRLVPELYGAYENKVFSCFAAFGGEVEGQEPARVEWSSGFILGKAQSPRFRCEGAYRRTTVNEYWKAQVRFEIPGKEGTYSVSCGTKDWAALTDGGPVLEFSTAIRARIPVDRKKNRDALRDFHP